MNDATILTMVSSLAATLFGLLVLIIGWLGNRLHNKLDEFSEKVHNRITGLDSRLSRLEGHCETIHAS